MKHGHLTGVSDANVLQALRGRRVAFRRNCTLERAITRPEAQALDQLQVAVHLVDIVREVAERVREAGSTELMGLPGAQGMPAR